MLERRTTEHYFKNREGNMKNNKVEDRDQGIGLKNMNNSLTYKQDSTLEN